MNSFHRTFGLQKRLDVSLVSEACFVFLRCTVLLYLLGSETADMVDCRIGALIKDVPVGQFWNGFDLVSGRSLASLAPCFCQEIFFA